MTLATIYNKNEKAVEAKIIKTIVSIIFLSLNPIMIKTNMVIDIKTALAKNAIDDILTKLSIVLFTKTSIDCLKF